MDVTVWLALLSGIAIAAACGLRAFMPLLLLGIAARMGLVELRGSMDWIATGIFAAGHVICHRLNFEDVDRAEFGDLSKA